MGVRIYSLGMCYASVCAPKEMAESDVVRHVDESHPTGLAHGWKRADETFRTGEPNPFDAGECGRHWLLSC